MSHIHYSPKHLLLTGFLLVCFGLVGCAGPYSGKPERLSKPKPRKRPKTAETAISYEENCRTNFFDAPVSWDASSARAARNQAKRADTKLVAADSQRGVAQVRTLKAALSTLRNALRKDPYSPEATYKLSVAYALLRQKGCSVALLGRLFQLTKHANVGDEAKRAVQRAVGDPSFGPFRKDALAALGE